MVSVKKLLIVSAIAAATTLTGCSRTATILVPNTTISSHVSADNVKNAILKAGLERDWVMTAVAPGVIDGELVSRDHSVKIRVTYSASAYQINYVSSENMRASGSTIHRNYNRWVHNLDKDIKLNLVSE